MNEPNQQVYLSGRNVPTLAINTAAAVQVRAPAQPWQPLWLHHAAAGRARLPVRVGRCLPASPSTVRRLIPARPPSLPFLPPFNLTSTQVYDVLNADRIVVEKSALAYLNEWFGANEQ